MKFLSKEKISNHRYKTPEGYLICLDAIIARTGKQDYTRNELFNDGKDDIVSIDRPAKEVFSSETTSSFENKPLVDEHPNEDVNVDNHRDYSIGFVRDVRKAVVDDEDVLIANLVITDPEAIAEIESGKKTELSCGYDCDILGDEGNYYQANIRGNHVALCKAGRAGIAKIIDSIEEKEMIEDKNLGQSFLKVGQKVHLDPNKNSRLDKETLNADYEVLGFWYDGKLVTKDPISKQEFLDFSGIRIKNTITGQKLSVSRFQLMDSMKDDFINDRPEGYSIKTENREIHLYGPRHKSSLNKLKNLVDDYLKTNDDNYKKRLINEIKNEIESLKKDYDLDVKEGKISKTDIDNHYKNFVDRVVSKIKEIKFKKIVDSIEDSKEDLAYNYKGYDVYKIPLNEKGDFKLEVKLNGKTPYKNGLKYGNFDDPQFDLKVKEEIDKDLKKSRFKKEEVEKELNRLGYKVDNWNEGDPKFGERNIVNLKPFWTDLKNGITNEELSKFKKDMDNFKKYADDLLISTTKINGIVVFSNPNFKLRDSIEYSKTLDSVKTEKLIRIIKIVGDSKVKDKKINVNIYVEEDIVYDFRDVRSLVKKYNCEVIKKVDKYPGYFRGSGGIYKVLVSGEKKDLNRLVTENYPNVYFDDKKKTL